MLCRRRLPTGSCTRMGGIEEKDTALSHDASSHKSKLYIPQSVKRLPFHPVCVCVCVLLCQAVSHTRLRAVITPSNDAGRGITAAVLCQSQTWQKKQQATTLQRHQHAFTHALWMRIASSYAKKFSAHLWSAWHSSHQQMHAHAHTWHTFFPPDNELFLSM